MKNLYTFLIAMLCVAMTSSAQNTVGVDVNASWVGYANVFELDGTYVFGEPWGVPDLKTVIDTGAETITLQPNFNAWGDGTDDFWVNQTTGEGNKNFEGNTYIEDPSLIGQELTFQGAVDVTTIDPAYVVNAFIKVFNADYSVLKIETEQLTEAGNFSVTYTNVEGSDAHLQYGFSVYGVVANPDDEAALGSVVVSNNFLGVEDSILETAAIYPNPTKGVWSLRSAEPVDSVKLYDVMGRLIQNQEVNSQEITLGAQNLPTGIYFAQIQLGNSVKVVKLVKN